MDFRFFSCECDVIVLTFFIEPYWPYSLVRPFTLHSTWGGSEICFSDCMFMSLTVPSYFRRSPCAYVSRSIFLYTHAWSGGGCWEGRNWTEKKKIIEVFFSPALIVCKWRYLDWKNFFPNFIMKGESLSVLHEWFSPLHILDPIWGSRLTPQYHSVLMFGGFRGIPQFCYHGAVYCKLLIFW